MREENINKIMSKYAKKYAIVIEKNKNLLIESFVKYYGEQHRNHITYVIENIKFYQYISAYQISDLKFQLKKYSKQILEKALVGKYNIENTDYNFENLLFLAVEFETEKSASIDLEQYKELEKILNDKDTITVNDQYEPFKIDKILSNYKILIKSDLEYINDFINLINYFNRLSMLSQYRRIYPITNNKSSEESKILKEVEEEIDFTAALAFHYSPQYISDKSFIFFRPALYDLDKILIHEINHAIVSNDLALIGDDSLFKKSGLAVSSSKYGFNKNKFQFEEVINDLSAIEITEIFHEMGGNLNIKTINITFNSGYNYLYDIVNKFYAKYKNVINEARITENYNLLYSVIDKEKYHEYETLIEKYSILKSNNHMYIPEDEKKFYKEQADILVDEMEVKPAYENFEKYIEMLRSEGYNVKVFNDIEDIDSKGLKMK